MDSTEAGRLLSLVSHELRTPVNVVGGYVRMALSGRIGALGDQQKQVLGQADRSTARLTSIINDLSELARIEGGRAEWHAEPVDLVALLDDVVASFSPPPGFSCGATRAGAPLRVPLEADPARLRRALAACLQAVARTAPAASAVVATLVADVDTGRVSIVIAPDALDPAAVAREASGHCIDEFVEGIGLEIPLARRVLARAGAALEAIPGGHRGLRILVAAG